MIKTNPHKCAAKIVVRCTAALVASICIAHAEAAVYSIVELGTLGGDFSSGSALNAHGQVVGASATATGESHPFLYGPQGMIDLGAPPGYWGNATAINGAGTVVGYFAETGGTDMRAFIYRRGVMTDLGRFGADWFSVVAINDAEVIIGQARLSPAGADTAYAWSGGKITDLGTLGGMSSSAQGLNNAGRIVGAATTPGDAEVRPVVWSNGVISDLGTLGGKQGNASGINERGQIVGDSRLPGDTVIHAFLYENGVMRDLDPEPDRWSSLRSINSSGDAVGPGTVYKGGQLFRLSSLINPYTDWSIDVQAINDGGLIAASGCRGRFHCRALLLTPLEPPEPPPSGQVNVIEFHHAGMDHFFISSLPADIDALDSGRFPGWERTGEYFRAYPEQAPGASPVCRFYIPPAFGDSHFFSASPAECAATRAKFPELVYETDEAFFIAAPDAQGNCPPNTAPVYRLWSRRADSNHRYTTDRGVRDTMVKAGWLAEGNGPDTTVMCAPK